MVKEIGFHADLSARSEKPKKAPEDCLLRFDSGNCITFEDARHHILVMGTTGSGKTASVVHPVLFRLIEADHSGVVVDIKGNLSGQARAFAKHCGRSEDIVEFGTSPTALPVNILKNMDIGTARSFFETLTMGYIKESSQNNAWYLNGAHQAADCFQLLRHLSKLNGVFEPTISLIFEMIKNFALSYRLFNRYQKDVFDKEDFDQYSFVEKITSDPFHIFNKCQGKDSKAVENSHQRAWNLKAIRMALEKFMDAPGISRGFSTKGTDGIDLRRLLAQKKIVLLRFSPDTGPIGASLARMILQDYYKVVYATGLTMPEGQYTFVCLDEFQAFADLGNGRESDTNFIAQAREFHAIFVASTQSMSALANQSNSLAAVEAFVSNCNARVLFYSDDVVTQNMAERYGDIHLNELRSGEAFVVQYDTKERSHSSGLETLNEAYKMSQNILQQSDYSVDENYGISAETETAEDMLLLNEILSGMEEKEAQENELEGKGVDEKKKIGPGPGNSLGGSLHSSLSFDRKRERALEDSKMRETEKVQPQDSGVFEKSEIEKRLRQKFPQFFPLDKPIEICIPVGWQSFVENAFQTFSQTGLQLKIGALLIEDSGALTVTADSDKEERPRFLGKGKGEGNVAIMNHILSETRNLCLLCGNQKKGSGEKRERNNHGGMVTLLCADCLSQNGLQLDDGPKVEA